ncbi:MAG: tetratricopeptide repeat protein [Candidatus Lokiarchaeota archaeon]|nr:tetratricopeptide repeat protein [Candidatus Lokiarchaeota archaeon]
MKNITKELLNKQEKITFLVGAGCSMEAPSRLPSAREFVKALVSMCAPPEENDAILSLQALRYEAIVEIVEKLIDKQLIFLDFLDLKTDPNIIHFFLAHNILIGNNVITTNFDYLIENALMKILPDTEKNQIDPIITREQFLALQNQNLIENTKKKNLYKIHGSKKNIITGQDTSKSLITTLAALGKDREDGKTFTIESYKKPAMLHALEGRTLVVLGYSGGDDFDIAPFIKELKTYRKIIWIEHEPNKTDLNALEIVNKYSLTTKLSTQLTRQEKFLLDISTESNIDVFLVKANTALYVSEVLWPLLIDSNLLPDIAQDKVNPAEFQEWIKSLKPYQDISAYKKYLFATSTYDGLGEWKSALRVSKKGLELARAEHNVKEEAEFLERVAAQLVHDSKLEEALNLLIDAKKIFDKLSDYEGIVACLSLIGNILFSMVKYQEAFSFYKQAYDLMEKITDLEDRTAILINLGSIQDILGDQNSAIKSFQEALKLVDQTGKLDDKAMILKYIGFVYMVRSEYENALNQFNESFQIFELLGDNREQASLYNVLGTTYLKLEDFEKALDHFLKGQQLATDIGYLNMQAIIALELAKYYDSAESEEMAQQYFQTAMELCEKVEDIDIKIRTLQAVAISCYNKKAYDEALEFFDIALNIANNTEDTQYITQLLEWIAAVHVKAHDYGKARNTYREIVNVYEESGDIKQKADYLRKLGTDWFNITKNVKQAVSFLQESQKVYKELGDKHMQKKIQEDIDRVKSRSKLM